LRTDLKKSKRGTSGGKIPARLAEEAWGHEKITSLEGIKSPACERLDVDDFKNHCERDQKPFLAQVLTSRNGTTPDVGNR